MFKALGEFTVRRPWWIIGFWLVAAVLIAALGPKLSSVTDTDSASFLPAQYESTQAAVLAKEAFPQSQNQTATIVYSKAGGGPLTADEVTEATAVSAQIASAGIPKVAGVTPPVPAQNLLVALSQVSIEGNAADAAVPDAAKAVRAEADKLTAGTDLSAALTGSPAIALDNQDAFDRAEGIVAVGTLLLIIILLLLIFRSPVAALLPILMVAVVFAISPPIITLVAKAFGWNIDSSLTTILIVVLFGIGTDYILFLLFRYREGLRAGLPSTEAVVNAVRTVGEAIASAALAVVFAFGVMLLASLGNLKSQGPGLAVAVVLMAIAALTLVPAVLSLVGPRIFWPSRKWRAQPKGAVFARLGGTVARRPLVTALASGGILVALACGAFTFSADYNVLDQLPSNTPSAEAFTLLQTGFPAGALAPSQVYLESTNGQPLDPAAVNAFATRLATGPGVGSLLPTPTKQLYVLSADGKTAQINVILKDDPYANSSLDVIADLRTFAHEDAAAQPAMKALVGGVTAAAADTRTATGHDEKVIFPVAAVLIALVLIGLLRSLVAPWYLLIAVGLTYLATLGATALFFQGVLGKAGLVSSLPITIYMFVVAIGSDYNILMVARLREEAKEGNDPRRAADLAIEHAGPSVASAGLILAGTFASLLLAGVALLMQLGFAVAIGIALAAFVMAMFLVPSLTALVGTKAWWPGHGGGSAGSAPSAHDAEGSVSPRRA